MYGHRTPEDVHSIMKKYKADYMILEDSICLSPRAGCRLPDIIDLDNGIVSKTVTWITYLNMSSSSMPRADGWSLIAVADCLVHLVYHVAVLEIPIK